MSFQVTCPNCGKEIAIVDINPGNVKSIHQWNGKPIDKEKIRIYRGMILILSSLSVLAVLIGISSLFNGLIFLLFLLPFLIFLFHRYDIDGVSVCPYCNKRFHIVGGETGVKYESKMPETETSLAKSIVRVTRGQGGLASLSVIFEHTGGSLEEIRESLIFLEEEDLLKNYGRYYLLPEKVGKDERKIIDLAEKTGGELSLKTIIKELGWESDRVQSTLNRLEEKGLTLRLDQPGRITWHFPGLLKEEVS